MWGSLISQCFPNTHFGLQHIGKCGPPEPQFSNPHRAYNESMRSESLSMRAGPPYTPSSPPTVRSAQVASPDVGSASSPPNVASDERGEAEMSHVSQRRQDPNPAATSVESAAQAYARSYVESLRTPSNRRSEFSQNYPSSGLGHHGDVDPAGNVVELDAIPTANALHTPRRGPETNEDPTSRRRLNKDEIHRQPHQNPVLAPEYRYCSRDEIIKPPRAHHCRICGTVKRITMSNRVPI